MQRHEEMEALIAGYALRALEPDEAAAFAEHAATCPDCSERLAEMRALADALPLTAPQVEPPPGLKTRVMEALRAESAGHPAPVRPRAVAPRPRVARRWLPPRATAVAAAVAAVLLIALVWTASTALDLRSRLDSSQARVSNLYEAMTVLAQADQRWEFSGSAIEPGANGVVAYSTEHQASVLMVWGLPERTAEADYVAWTGSNGTRRGVGAMRRNNGGLWILMPGNVSDVDSVGITLRDRSDPNDMQTTDVVIVSLAGR